MKVNLKRWQPMVRVTNSEMRMADLLNRLIDDIERLPEEDQLDMVKVIYHHFKETAEK